MSFLSCGGCIIAKQKLELVPDIKLCYSTSCIMILSCNKYLKKYLTKYIIVVKNVPSLFKERMFPVYLRKYLEKKLAICIIKSVHIQAYQYFTM